MAVKAMTAKTHNREGNLCVVNNLQLECCYHKDRGGRPWMYLNVMLLALNVNTPLSAVIRTVDVG